MEFSDGDGSSLPRAGGGQDTAAGPSFDEGSGEYGSRNLNNTQQGNNPHAQPPTQAPRTLNPQYTPATREPRQAGRRPANQRPNERSKRTRAVIKIASLNMNGAGSAKTRQKWMHVNQIVRDNRIGILALQETHLSEELLNSLHSQFPRLHIQHTSDPQRPNAKGVAIVINKYLLPWKETTVYNIIPGRAMLMTVPWHKESRINVLAIYAPNAPAENADMWRSLKDKWNLSEFPMPDILLGDFNIVETSLDRLPAHPDPRSTVNELEEFKSDLSLMDGWRHNNPTARAFSYHQKSSGASSRIDRIYTTEAILENSREWKIENSGMETDHKIVSMQFSNPGAPFIGKGRWTMPLSLLKDREMITQIKKLGASTLRACELELQDQAQSQRLPNPGRTELQVLYKSFKKGLNEVIRQKARTTIPKLENTIKHKEKMLKSIQNNSTSDEEEKALLTTALEEEIRILTVHGASSHQNTRQPRSQTPY